MNASDLSQRYYLDLAAAYVRGRIPVPADLAPEAVFGLGEAAGLRLHRFKRTADLPRVRRVLGILHGLTPTSLLDVGSGRGVFLWPLLLAFPGLPVLAIDQNDRRVADLQAVARGGGARLTPQRMDVTRLALADRSVDVVTFLEVLEHLRQPERAATEALRVAQRWVVVSVPSKADDNPEHIHLFSTRSLEELLRSAGAQRVRCEGVLNHLIAVARV